MRNIMLLRFICLLICIGFCGYASARTINHKEFRFTITVPDQLIEFPDSAASEQGTYYYDTSAGIILMISVIEKSKFHSVDDYIDCSREGLEHQLQQAYEDTGLTLISCSKPAYYPQKTTSIHFRIASLPSGHDTYIIYFIHHRHKDIQISFTYKKEAEQSSQSYIDGIMRSLVLK